ALRGQPPYRLEPAGPLRRERDHPHRPAAPPQQVGQLGEGRVPQVRRVVCAPAGRREVRPFQVDAGEYARADQGRERRDRGARLLSRGGDQAGEDRGGAVPEVELGGGPGGGRVRGGEAVPTTAVTVDIHEAGQDQVVAGVAVAERDRDDPVARDLHLAGADLLRRHHPPAEDHLAG